MNSRHVVWRGHTPVYHLRGIEPGLTRCGRPVACERWRCQEGTEHQARRLGLRPCRSCSRSLRPA